jgi:lipopolysaccharide heptosyltransferase II
LKDSKMILKKSAGKVYRKFLIINPFGIGDVLHSTPIIQAIKAAYPDSFIAFWCNQRCAGLLKNNPALNKVFPLSRGDIKKIYQQSKWVALENSLKLFLGLGREKFDVVLDFSLDHRYGLVTLLAGIKKRIGFDYKNRGKFLTDKIPLKGYADRHVVDYYRELLKPLGIESKTYNLEFPATEASIQKIKKMLHSRGLEENDLLIGIFPGGGASWGMEAGARHWPALRFAQLADLLIQQCQAKIVILGDKSERPLADIVRGAMKNKSIDLVGMVELEDLSALLRSLKLLVSNDGGPLHMAVASGISTVSIFGPVDDLVYGAYPPGADHFIVKSDLDCRPCYSNFRLAVCDKDRECLRQVSVGAVFDAAVRLLK